MLSSYGIQSAPTSIKNPRGNAIVERMHLTAGDMLRTAEFEGDNWQYESNRTLQTVTWAIRSTVSTVKNYSSGQLVFSKDMIMQVQVIAEWERIKELRRTSIVNSNTSENKGRVVHEYKCGDKVLILLR